MMAQFRRDSHGYDQGKCAKIWHVDGGFFLPGCPIMAAGRVASK
jgi:hypothetical protein